MNPPADRRLSILGTRLLPWLLLLIVAMSPWVPAAHAAVPLDDPSAINAALAQAAPGDTVLVKNGLYRDAHLSLTASGQEGKWITLAAETPGRVTFTGRSRITMAGKYQHVTGLVFQKNIAGLAVAFADNQAQHCRLSHTAFNESGDPQSTFAHLIDVGENAADNQVDHCYLARSLSMSVGTRYGAVRSRFDHNWFRDIVAKSSNGQEAIQLQGYRLAKDNLVANNTVADAKSTALSIGVYYGLTRPDRPGEVNNVLPTGNQFYNNVLTADGLEIVALHGNGRFADNDFQANLIACTKTRPGQLPRAAGLIAAETPLIARQADRFVPAVARLAAGRGVAIDGLKEDFAGRACKPNPDIGCEELDAGAAVRKPLTLRDVGPQWMNGDDTVLEKSAALDDLRDLLRRYPDPEFRRQLKSLLEEATYNTGP